MPNELETMEIEKIENVGSPAAEASKQRILAFAQSFNEVKIKNDSDSVKYQNDFMRLKSISSLLEKQRIALTKPILDKKKVIDAYIKDVEKVLSSAKEKVEVEILRYDREQESIRKEEEKKLQERARKEEERKRKAIEVKAEKAESKGNEEKAEELREQAQTVHVPRPILSVTAPIKGKRKIWYAKIVDEPKVPEAYWIKEINQKLLDTLAKTTKGKSNIPGVEFYYEEILASSRTV